jgi:hypothetical protein
MFQGVCNGRNIKETCEDTENICEAVFRTRGSTCNRQCQSLGLTCENGWNDVSGTCRKNRRDRTGCGKKRQLQICRCKQGKTMLNTI